MLELISRDGNLNFHHECAPAEVIFRVGGTRQDETFHDDWEGDGKDLGRQHRIESK